MLSTAPVPERATVVSGMMNAANPISLRSSVSDANYVHVLPYAEVNPLYRLDPAYREGALRHDLTQ